MKTGAARPGELGPKVGPLHIPPQSRWLRRAHRAALLRVYGWEAPKPPAPEDGDRPGEGPDPKVAVL